MKLSVFVPVLGLMLAVGLTLPPAFASGTETFGQGGATTGGSSSADYTRGKRVARDQLLCKSCPLAGQKLDATLAGKVLADAAMTAKMSSEDRASLLAYLRRRFDI